MNIIQQTLKDLTGINFLLTRFDKSNTQVPNDLDILVRPVDFQTTISLLQSKGYTSSSHDQALGGRLPGMQINLVRQDRLKIDLHQDFTWRKAHYLDLSLVWAKTPQIEQFLVLINTIFEKTYLLHPEFEFLQTFAPTPLFATQAAAYGWSASYAQFLAWWGSRKSAHYHTPIFLPVWLILLSYLEKFDPISLAYYLFFRIRYAFNGLLPYD